MSSTAATTPAVVTVTTTLVDPTNKKRKRVTLRDLYPKASPLPRTAFNLYVADRKAKLSKEEYDIKAVRESWKALEDKSEWEQKAREDKERYAALCKELGYEYPAPKKAKKVREGPCPPYLNFSRAKQAEVRKNNGNCSYREATKILGAMWKAMTPEEKAAFHM